jgi:hypothetical protein
METVTITKQNASAAYNAADAGTKKMLEALLGKENITLTKITDRIKTFDDAINALAKSEIDMEMTTLLSCKFNDPLLVATKAAAMLMVITKVLNEGWVPDWTKSSEYKWYPWFDMQSGSGLSFHVAVRWSTGTSVSSRLCFKSRELAEYAGKQFADLYTQFFIIK